MLPHNLHSLLLAAIAVGVVACGGSTDRAPDGREESFLAALGSTGKADTLGLDLSEGSLDARAVLQVANTLTFREFEAIGIDRRATAHLVAHRDGDHASASDDDPFDTLVELDRTPWVGVDAFVHLHEHAIASGIRARLAYPLECVADADCGVGRCYVDRCYDVTEVELPDQPVRGFGVAGDGQWWVRLASDATTVTDVRGDVAITSTQTTALDSDDHDTWILALPDGSLTAVTRVGAAVAPEFGPPLDARELRTPTAAIYDASGDLWVAFAARDAHGTAQGLVVMRQLASSWQEEFKAPFDSPLAPGESVRFAFTRDLEGRAELWVDAGPVATRYSRDAAGSWRSTLRIEMAESGFGARANDRTVRFVPAADGTTLLHRACGQFSRAQELLRIEGNLLTSVVQLPHTTAAVTTHNDGTSSVVLADGQLARVERGELYLSDVVLSPGDLRAAGEDLVLRDGARLTVLRRR